MTTKAQPQPSQLPALPESTDEVKIVSQCDLDQAMYDAPLGWIVETLAEAADRGWSNHPDWGQRCEDTQRWCADHSASYYAAPKGDFCIRCAIDTAKAEGNKIVVIDNLS